MTSPKNDAPVIDPTDEQIAANLAAMQAVIDAQSPAPAVKALDFTAGKRSVEVLFKMITEALDAGVSTVALSELYEARAEQLDRNPNTTTKRVCRELHDMTQAALSATTVES